MRSLVLVAVLAVAACSKPATNGTAPVVPTAKPATALDPSTTVASIDGAPVTAGELDAKIKTELDTATQEYVEKVHEIRRENLEGLLVDRMFEAEAKAKGITVDQLVDQEIKQKAGKPTEEDLQSAYDRFVKGQYPVTFEDAKPQLAMQLGREKETLRARAYIDELKTKHKVTTSLPQPEVRRVEVAATGPSAGDPKAPVTIVTFSDFECPFCSRVIPTVHRIEQEYAGKVRIVFRQYPLPMHPNAPKAGEASLCAHDQGKFWEMHDKLFAQQDRLSVPDLKELAKSLGLDTAKFDACLDSGEKGAIVKKDMKEGQAAGVNGTPAFFINGRLLSGAQPYEAFKEIIDAELAAKK